MHEIVENGGIMFVEVRFYFRSRQFKFVCFGSIDNFHSSISLLKIFEALEKIRGHFLGLFKLFCENTGDGLRFV